MLIMANYEITEGQTNLILVSTPTYLAIGYFYTNLNSLAQKISKIVRMLISAHLAPNSDACLGKPVMIRGQFWTRINHKTLYVQYF